VRLIAWTAAVHRGQPLKHLPPTLPHLRKALPHYVQILVPKHAPQTVPPDVVSCIRRWITPHIVRLIWRRKMQEEIAAPRVPAAVDRRKLSLPLPQLSRHHCQPKFSQGNNHAKAQLKHVRNNNSTTSTTTNPKTPPAQS
jgi:hypothetical protein